MAKPMKKSRRFAEGNLVGGTTNVRTRSDDEIGDTNPRTGVYTPGSYDARQKAGESNLNAVKGLWNRITGGSSDDAGTGTRGIKASVSDTKYEPTKSSVADYIGKSTEPKSSSEDSSGGSYKGDFQSSKGTSSAGNINFGAKKSSVDSDTSDRRGNTTITGKQVDQDNTNSYEDKKPVVKTEDKKPAKTEDKKPAKTENKRTDASSSGDEMSKYASTKKAETKKPETKKPEIKKSEVKKSNPGNVPTSEEAAANRQAAYDKVKKVGSSISDYFSNFETPAEARARRAKEDKNKPVAKRSGGTVKKMASGGMASSRGDGIAQRGKTRGKMC
jgi:hypothetical protein